jgi:hypothetical protein
MASETEFAPFLTTEELAAGWRWEEQGRSLVLFPPGPSTDDRWAAHVAADSWDAWAEGSDLGLGPGAEPMPLGQACAIRALRQAGQLPPVCLRTSDIDPHMRRDAVTRYWADRCSRLRVAMARAAESLRAEGEF